MSFKVVRLILFKELMFLKICIDPLGQPIVTAGIIVFVYVVRTYVRVRPHFSNVAKQNNRKQCSLLA